MNIQKNPKYIFIKRVVNSFLSPKIHGSFNKKSALEVTNRNTEIS